MMVHCLEIQILRLKVLFKLFNLGNLRKIQRKKYSPLFIKWIFDGKGSWRHKNITKFRGLVGAREIQNC